MATPKKKASKKRKAKKARKSPRASASKKAAAKKRAAKSKRVVKKAQESVKKRKESCKKAVKKRRRRKPQGNLSKKPSKKPAKTASTKTRRAAQEAATVPVAKPPAAPKSPKAVAPRAKPPAAVAPPAAPPRNTYFITTAIFYPNGMPHIGHAYTAMATDAIARFQRLDGNDVLFLTGTDEHGLKMHADRGCGGPCRRSSLRTATPRASATWTTALNISFDDFIRTTEPRTRASRARRSGKRSRRTAISISTNMPAGIRFVRRPISTKRKPLSADDMCAANRWARRSSGPRRRPISSACRPIRTDCSTSMQRMPDFVLPRERLNEVASFVKGGLQDLSVSRTTFDWGIKVPGAPSPCDVCLARCADQLHHGRRLIPTSTSAEFQRYWPANLHVTGKDIVRFHAVYWPAFLMSAGVAVPQRGLQPTASCSTAARRCRSPSAMSSTPSPGGAIRRRSGALFLHARGVVRTGRQLQS